MITKVHDWKPKSTFPLIARSKAHDIMGMIVLFSDETAGTVLFDPSNDYAIGYWCADWTPVSEIDTWEVLDEVTLTFES